MELRTAIDSRRTEKVLANPEEPFVVPESGQRQKVSELLALAAQAPFHKPADESHRVEPLSSIVPWRFHALDSGSCRLLLDKLEHTDKPTGKIRNMLAAADSLVMSTWLPNPSGVEQYDGFQEFEPTLQNMEHIAAASAAIQNLLLLATESGWKNYWSSGGVLRSEMVYEWLDIPFDQILLGAIFLFPSDIGGADVKPGGLRDRKGDATQWSQWATVK